MRKCRQTFRDPRPGGSLLASQRRAISFFPGKPPSTHSPTQPHHNATFGRTREKNRPRSQFVVFYYDVKQNPTRTDTISTLPEAKIPPVTSHLSSPFSSTVTMPPKAARNGHDDPKAETPTSKEKNGNSGSYQSNGKLRRVASSTGSNLREVTSVGAGTATTSAPTSAPGAASNQETPNPGVSDYVLLLFAIADKL